METSHEMKVSILSLLLCFFLLPHFSANSSPSTGVWTWISGSELYDRITIYGAKGVPAADNVPGARYRAVSWRDSSGNLWLFGGQGMPSDALGNTRGLDDVWKFDGKNWTWVAGSMLLNPLPDYGVKGKAASTNTPGGRQNSITWLDDAGNLWLFGGRIGYIKPKVFDDVWKFDGKNWTWVAGSNLANQPVAYGTQGEASSTNTPGSRSEFTTWIDSKKRLWLFGGWKPDFGGAFNDLWRFDGRSWTWIRGGGTTDGPDMPGPRAKALSWADRTGNLWLLGGVSPAGEDEYGYDIFNTHSDLWKFDGKGWTLAAGSKEGNQAGSYGEKGKAADSNTPGARTDASTWVDSAGDFWLFGGNGYDSRGKYHFLNDLWKFDGRTWTWIAGSNRVDQAGNYGTRGAAAATNVPGARHQAFSWADRSGNLWLFGGRGYDANGNFESLSDVWKFDGARWTWMAGSSTEDRVGHHGKPGKSDPSNTPGFREHCATWVDPSGKLWLFGGSGFNQQGRNEWMNDLWVFNP